MALRTLSIDLQRLIVSDEDLFRNGDVLRTLLASEKADIKVATTLEK